MNMMEDYPDEVIITSASNFVYVYDSKGTKVKRNFKVGGITPKCLALLGEDYFLGASATTPEIKSWFIGDVKPFNVMSHTVGLVSALVASHCGTYCAAAFKTEISVWNVKSGEILTSFTRHYQDVTCLRFSSDDSLLLTGGKDGNVLVWMFSKLISVNSSHEFVKPIYTWNNHSKEVTDIFIGAMDIYSRVATTSVDMTCKIYELDTGLLLTTVCFDVALTSVVMDPLEYFLILGMENGKIFKINLYDEMPVELHSNGMVKEEVKAHEFAVLSLSMSVFGDKLLSTSTDRTFKIWEVASLTCLSSNRASYGVFTNAYFALQPAPLQDKDATPQFAVKPLQKCFVPQNLTSKERRIKPLKPQNHTLSLTHLGIMDEFYGTTILHVPMNQLPTTQTENEFQEVLRGETLNEVRDINTQLYSYMIEHAMKSMGTRPYKEKEINS